LEATAIDEKGYPLRLVVIDPRAFELHKAWVSEREDREPLKAVRDLEQAKSRSNHCHALFEEELRQCRAGRSSQETNGDCAEASIGRCAKNHQAPATKRVGRYWAQSWCEKKPKRRVRKLGPGYFAHQARRAKKSGALHATSLRRTRSKDQSQFMFECSEILSVAHPRRLRARA
jgi:hypothetical protein